MLWTIKTDGDWFNVTLIGNGRVEDSFDNQEDAERYMAHLEAEDAKHVMINERM